MDSVVSSIDSRSKTPNWEYRTTSRRPASVSDSSLQPPPPNASRHDNSPATYYACVRGQAVKSTRHPSGSVNNQKHLYETAKDGLQCHEGQPSSSSNGRSEFLDLNCTSAESSPKEKVITRKAWIMHPVDDPKNSNSSGSLEFDCIVPGPSERDVFHLNKHMASQLAMDFPSPNSMYTANLYVEAKESPANTEVSEEESTIEKSAGSDKVSSSYDIDSRKTGFYRESSGSDVSDESSSNTISCSMYKPHKANDRRWEAIQAVKSREGALEFKNFRLLMRLGCGDIGSVYLAELIGTRTFFAMKVMDKAALLARKKVLRALTEREILQSLDHPFLPTLYTHFDTDKSSCLLMEFCPGGDLHALRQRQPGKCFREHAARFYVAEVLLALEYLHMLGIIYRDLKPENVLVREDGHIMLSDFDLSLRCAVCPTLVKSSDVGLVSKNTSHCAQPACIEPTCIIQPDCIQPACFGPRFLSEKSKKDKKNKPKNETNSQSTPLPELIAEPTNARSMSFVGTHEYLAPEIIKCEGHGSAVDWWTFGIFLYELLFGKTPFKGAGNRATLFNVIGQPLTFPESTSVSFAARDLIRGLLVKEPQNRLAYRRGATEIKQHPFFQNVNWALIRCTNPPEVPQAAMLELQLRAHQPKSTAVGSGSENVEGPYVKPSSNYYEIDLF